MLLSETTKNIQKFMKQYSNLENISNKDISDFYIQLIDCIIDHNHLYYVENKPIISDKEYDELFDYLKKIEEYYPTIITSNSPTQILIGQTSEGFIQAKHETKLLSLENTYNAKDLEERDKRTNKILLKHNIDSKILYQVEPKFDGISVELIYKKGIFHQAITRGDGLVGEDVTENVKTIKNLPMKLNSPIDINVRGEILMPKSVWKEINIQREEDGEIPFANTRNAAAGSIKLLDIKEVIERRLICYIYDILDLDKRSKTKDEKSNQEIVDLNNLGLPVFPRKKDMENIQEIISLCENIETKKYLEKQDIEFDGLVIKVKDENQRKIIGSTEHHPRRAVAYKFPAQLIATQILSVDSQVGRTGIITPVANLNPVQLSGAKIQRVSLHNFDFINSKNIQINDRIWLQRSGEVIPYIVSTITDRRAGEEKNIIPPKNCPSCKGLITQKEMHYYCQNLNCPEKIKQQIQHFVSKNCMDIQGIGESIIDLLVKNKIIQNIADIYKLIEKNIQIQLLKFPGFGDKKITEIVRGIEESKHKALRRLINGLGISNVGKKIAQDISKQMNNPALVDSEDGFLNLISNEDFLRSIYGIGEKTIENIIKFFNDKNNIKLLNQLQKYGINLDPKKYTDFIKAENAKGSFSITGSFDVPREKITEIFQKNGYVFHEQPTKNTDFILIGEKAGSKKIKAQEIGIIIYEGWDNICQKFPFLKDEIMNNETKPKVQSLF